jgi:excisionase family DNA binding protein
MAQMVVTSEVKAGSKLKPPKPALAGSKSLAPKAVPPNHRAPPQVAAREAQQVERVLLPVPEVAEMIGRSRSGVYKLIHDGFLPYVRLGDSGQIRVPKKAIDDLIEAALAGTGTPTTDTRPGIHGGLCDEGESGK